ncbi:MAG: helix-turn-helix transcriptional regulator [Lachnospiraceae bacterium]|nr:helix-turn-helix transcriptional regulator [Lachnospiraceae bacterium]
MFDETLKRIRKEKSMTQEELAIKVHVARQTVSKWEKGLSIPDVDLLQRIAEALDVEVSELLGAQVPKEENRNEVAEQLAKISEQMAIRNKRGNAIWKMVKALILVLILIPIACWILAAIFSMTPREGKVRVEESEKMEYVVEELED